EENVWKLCDYIRSRDQYPLEEFYAVFISNERRMIPLWKQKSGHGDEPVVWVKHFVLYFLCILLFSSVCYALCEKEWALVLCDKCSVILPPSSGIILLFRKVRMIRADLYLRTFASDRSHMKDANGKWQKPPPSYPCIETADSKMNLDDFISMNPKVGWGSVFPLMDFVHRFGRQT
ncbi:NTAQ1 amidohydrolase, partial [Nothocercus nigrocapillus]|nr:NTAQ1 amidohydrolase [Nothocercus nigrocapillus]